MRYIINGPCVASGEITVSGAKNFSIKALALALLQDGELEYDNIPDNLDVAKTCKMLRQLGADVQLDVNNRYCKVNTTNVCNVLDDDTHANMMVFLLGAALIHKFDFVQFPKLNKGCPLGKRADDFHIMAFEKFGMQCIDNENAYVFKKNNKLVGCDIILPYPSVGATETAIFLGVRASGMTRIFNAAMEPEVQALITALITIGARIFFAGDREIVIHGVDKLKSNTRIYIHGDYLEAASWGVMAAVTGGEITVHKITPELIGSFLGIFNMLGGKVERLGSDCLRFSRDSQFVQQDRALMLETGVYPKLRTDLQPLLAALAGVQGIRAIVHDTVYDDRVRYVETFRQFGIKAEGSYDCFDSNCRFHESVGVKSMHSAVIDGVDELIAPANTLVPLTIRCGMAKIILAAAARGVSIIDQVEIVERGYCNLFNKLLSIGVDIKCEG